MIKRRYSICSQVDFQNDAFFIGIVIPQDFRGVVTSEGDCSVEGHSPNRFPLVSRIIVTNYRVVQNQTLLEFQRSNRRQVGD